MTLFHDFITHNQYLLSLLNKQRDNSPGVFALEEDKPIFLKEELKELGVAFIGIYGAENFTVVFLDKQFNKLGIEHSR